MSDTSTTPTADPAQLGDALADSSAGLVDLLGGVEAIAELSEDYAISGAPDEPDPADLSALGDVGDEPDDEPDDEPLPPAATVSPDGVTDLGEGGGPPPAPSPDPDNIGDLALAMYRDQFGTEPTPEALAEAMGIVADFKRLTPEQLAAVGRAIQQPQQFQPQPQYQPQPPGTVPHAGAGVPQGPDAAPVPGAVPPLPDYVEPEVRAAFEAQQAQLAALTQQQQYAFQRQQEMEFAEAQQRVARDQQVMEAAVATAEERFIEANPGLSSGDLARIRLKAREVSTTTWPTYLAQAGGDATMGVQQMLEASLMSIPDLHKRVTDARVQQAVDIAMADEKRKTKAGAVAGGASAAPRKPRGQISDKQAANEMIAAFRELESGGMRFE